MKIEEIYTIGFVKKKHHRSPPLSSPQLAALSFPFSISLKLKFNILTKIKHKNNKNIKGLSKLIIGDE